MRVDLAVLKKLQLTESASAVVSGNLDRFPSLLIDRCLTGAASILVTSVVADYQAGVVPVSETLTMPRRGFGPRPVVVPSPRERVLYRALVQKLTSEFADGRDFGAWQLHEQFGDPGRVPDPWAPDYYLVEFDIASCYEYIDHGLLRDELVAQTMDASHVEYLATFLGELSDSGRGLPQLSSVSDALADIYLEVLERHLLRDNSKVSRFADDFKVIVDRWGEANGVIEDAAEYARRLGFILSSDKTGISKRDTLAARNQEEYEFFERYFSAAKDESEFRNWFNAGGYGMESDVEDDPTERQIQQEAMRSIVNDWYGQRGRSSEVALHGRMVSAALGLLADTDERLPDDLLHEVVFRQPLRLESVVKYLLLRPNSEDDWPTIDRLSSMERQSPWAKIWLLHLADETLDSESESFTKFSLWVAAQLDDRHEIVRSEAAWWLAQRKRISESDLSKLYRMASSISRPAIAASCGARGLGVDSGLVKAACGDSKLSKNAYSWGASS